MVGYNRSLNTIVVALHGSINTADWVSNFNSYAVNLQTLGFPSQAAALAQILFGDLCQHLRNHYGKAFSNARQNRVHLWALSSPVALDATAKAFIEGQGGEHLHLERILPVLLPVA
jgi:hypothetical protein